jgi:hypothetical protein
MAPNFPKLAGQGERYLDQADARHQVGKRTVLEMTGMLTNLSDQDLADIAAYFSSQKGSVGAADPKLVARGRICSAAATWKKACPPAPAATRPTAQAAAAGFPHLGGNMRSTSPSS